MLKDILTKSTLARLCAQEPNAARRWFRLEFWGENAPDELWISREKRLQADGTEMFWFVASSKEAQEALDEAWNNQFGEYVIEKLKGVAEKQRSRHVSKAEAGDRG